MDSGALNSNSGARFWVSVAWAARAGAGGTGRRRTRVGARLGALRLGCGLNEADTRQLLIGWRGLRCRGVGMHGGWLLAELLTASAGTDVRHVVRWTDIVVSSAHEEATVRKRIRVPESSPKV